MRGKFGDGGGECGPAPGGRNSHIKQGQIIAEQLDDDDEHR